MTKDLFGAANG